ncbi:MAG: entericidin EcnA/B family protein [Rhodobacteraceae bacterium]|nr:entericidin EcnA/B family protein [Alphaproteobacteria bacterium]MBT8476820.1 entericidin EcnA/B family protein [Alphaproteobacteria bacterium]NNK67558.1 entericidin EcnA/B family protein [Paracoccaceae bacterium]
MKKLVIVALVLTLAGCATVEGLGRDISAGSRKVSNAL